MKSIIFLNPKMLSKTSLYSYPRMNGKRWENGKKIRYRNVKRNYEALTAIGNRKCWVPVSLGNMKQVFTLRVHLARS